MTKESELAVANFGSTPALDENEPKIEPPGEMYAEFIRSEMMGGGHEMRHEAGSSEVMVELPVDPWRRDYEVLCWVC